MTKGEEAGSLTVSVLQAVAAANPVTAVAAGLFQARRDHQMRRWTEFVNELLSSFSDEFELLSQRLADDRIQELIHQGLRRAEEARRSQVRVLALIVAEGVRADDTEKIDRAHLLLDMAADLEPMHIQVLNALAPPRQGDPKVRGSTAVPARLVEEWLPALKGFASPILSSLVARGLVTRQDVETDPRSKATTQRREPLWAPTGFALALLEFLLQTEEGKPTPSVD